MGSFIPGSRHKSSHEMSDNEDSNAQNSQIIHNATIQQEVNSPPKSPSVYQPHPPYAYMHAYPPPYQYPNPHPPQRQGLLYQIFKWILLPILLMTVLSNHQIMGMLGNIIYNMLPSLPITNMVTTITKFWYSSPLYEPIKINITKFEDSIEEIKNFVGVDPTPMSKFAVSMKEASRSVNDIRDAAIRALSKTNIPQEYREKTEEFYNKVVLEMRLTRQTASDANTFYLQHREQLGEIRLFLHYMKDSIELLNIPDFLDQIDEIIKLIKQELQELKRIKREFEMHQEKMEQYMGISGKLQNDVVEQKQVSEETERWDWKKTIGKNIAATFGTGLFTGGAASTLAPYLVSALAPYIALTPIGAAGAVAIGTIGSIPVGLYSISTAADGVKRIESALVEFENAADTFKDTKSVLSGCVDAIGTIIENLEEISINLRTIKKKSDTMANQLGEMQRRKIISDPDKRRLFTTIDHVIEATRNGQKKLERK